MRWILSSLVILVCSSIDPSFNLHKQFRPDNNRVSWDRSYESATIAIQMAEDEGMTLMSLTERGDANYVVVEAFYWDTYRGNKVLVHKEATTPLTNGLAWALNIPLPLARIEFLRVKEMKILNQSEFGKVPGRKAN